jgi:transmembrane protein EpsG
MMIWTALCGFISKGSESTCIIEGRHEKRTNYFFALITMAYIVLFMGSLCGAFDLPAYENGFNAIPSEPSQISEYMDNLEKYPGFYGFQILFKTYVSTQFHHFTTVVVAFDCIVIAYVFRKYSSDFALSVFIFLASGKFLLMGNAVKQFLATCIIFAFSKFLFEKKFLPFAAIVIAASTFHTSALVVLPFYFFVHGKPWNKKMMLVIIGSILSITFLSSFTSILDSVLEATDYDSASYSDAMKSGNGSNILHFLIAAVPPAIAFIGKKKVEEKAPQYINVCINMSIVSACIYLIASFTSGILMGRMPIYFQMYSFIALPWLLNNVFDKETQKTVKIICIACYLIMYYLVFFRMPYYSVVLGIYITP